MQRPARVTPTGNAGFTLLELVVVMAIVALAAAMSIPTFVQWQARYQLKSATYELANSLNLARWAAMKRNTTVSATLSMAGTYRANFGDVLPPITFSQGISGTLSTVTFNSLGMCAAGAGIITISNATGQTYSINITPGGRIRWCPNSTGIC